MPASFPGNHQQRIGRRGRPTVMLGAALLAACCLGGTAAQAQVSPDQQAAMVLDSARKAYNEKNYPFAVQRFQEFLAKFGNHKEAPSARYGLALCLLEGPDRNYNGAVEQLQPLLGSKDVPEYPFILYYFALAKRGQGVRELAEAVAKPQEAQQHRNNANQRFEEASQQFAAAAAAFQAKAKEPPADAKELPVEMEWAARARCDQAEMQIRVLKPKEAQATAAPFLKDPWAKSRYRGLGLYYHGFASFLVNDNLAAGRSLNLLTPFSDPVFGTHARYLLARIHHLEGERAEAAAQYDGVITDHAKQKQAAAEALKQPDKFKNDPEEKARLEALTKDPPPDHVVRATFYMGVLQYEDGRFADALTRFTTFAQQQPASPLAAEAQLRQGFCQVQLKQYAEALKVLQPLVDKSLPLADQALFWIAKAQAGAADPANPPAYDQALKTAINTFRQAADRAGQLGQNDPEAKARRGDILLELADTQQLDKLHKDAAATYSQILNEKALPQRGEEVLEHQITAQHLAGDYAESDKLCAAFQQAYPKSTLLPAVLFRQAENAYFTALAAEKNPNLPNRAQELARLNEEVIKRYQAIIDKYPEFAYVNLARYGVAMGHYRKGDIEKAKGILEAIPAPDRTGELAVVPYVLADCLIRLAPTRADDALAAGKLEEELKGAIDQLNAFVGAQPNAPQTPDALLKLGLCHQRLAVLLAEPQAKAKVLGDARAAYERLMQQFPKHELQPQAVLERAKCIAQSGDVNGGINELRRFTNDPALKTATVAPLAILELATLLRGQNQAAAAADVIAQARPQYEPILQKDPARTGWVALLQYHQGVALREAGKRPEARAVLDQVVKQAAGRPEAFEAALRWGQCLKEEGLQKVDVGRKRLATPNLKPEEVAAANRDVEAGLKDLRDTVQFLEAQADQLKQKKADAEGRARMLYEAAWCCRTLADAEIDAVRSKMEQEQWQKLKDEAAKKAPPGRVPVVPKPEVALAAIPVQPSEQKARALYQALVEGFPDLPLGVDARLELSELLGQRGDNDPAIKLLRDALDKEPPADLTDRICLRLGQCYFDKGDAKEGLAQFRRVAQNPKSAFVAQAHYRAGEALMRAGDWDGAVKELAVFRDQPPFQNVAGISDRALLRLGHAYAQLKQWEPSRQAHEQVVARFGNGPWGNEARYGMGWALQNMKRYDEAVNVYAQVLANTVTELGAKAQLQTGLCRMEQKRYPEAATALLVVPFTYDYPELSAVSLVEAARCFAEMKQRDQASKLLERVIKDHPDSEWAKVAKERLEGLGKGS